MPIVSQNKAETRERRLHNVRMCHTSLDRCFHKPCRCLCVSQLQPRDDYEGFGESNEYVCRSLNPDVDTVRSGDVYVVLKYSSIHHRERSHPEASGHLQDGSEVDFILAKQRVYHNLFLCQLPLSAVLQMRLTIKQRDEDDQRDRVEILQEVIWSTMQRHCPGLRDEIVPNLDPTYKV